MAHCQTSFCGARAGPLSDITSEIATIVGDARVLTGAAVSQRVTSFWNSAPMQGKAIVLPGTTEEVAAILKACHAHGQTVVTQGGLTNCVAAAEPGSDDIVLSLEKMNRIDEIDAIGGTVVVEAGAILQNVQEAVASEGLRFPLDLGARGSCTIGGNIATNAGGINVLRYGMMRNLVLGLEVVLADGTIVSSMNRMLKNNAGYDIKQLFIGSEGTLGVVTRVVLRLFPRPAARHTALVAATDFDAVAGFLSVLQQRLPGSLSAYEVMWGDYYRGVTGEGGHRPPLDRDYPYYAVLQTEGSEPVADAERLEIVLGEALEHDRIVDAVIPKSEAESAAIWDIRENFEQILEPQPVYLYDVSLPIRAMPDYVAAVQQNLTRRWPEGRLYVFGHMADGNLHLFVKPFESGDHRAASDELVYQPLAGVGGSVSAEHGIGVEKLRWLQHSRTPAEIALMRTLKRSLDPTNLLNPGRVLAE